MDSPLHSHGEPIGNEWNVTGSPLSLGVGSDGRFFQLLKRAALYGEHEDKPVDSAVFSVESTPFGLSGNFKNHHVEENSDERFQLPDSESLDVQPSF